LGILPVGGLWGEFKIQAMYVDALSEGSRTRVRFPPPPPFMKEKAPMILGLFYFLKINFDGYTRICENNQLERC